jgi:hypothetical protein
MNALQHLLHDQDYLTAKARLEAQGYTAVPHKGLIPFIFEKPTEDTLYLFRPALDGRSPYRVEVIPHDVLRPVYFTDYSKPVLYIPSTDYIEPKKGTVRYYWHPRRLEDAPIHYIDQGLVTKQDISEMLAVSQMNIHYATHSGRNRLAEHSSIGGCKLYHTDAVLHWNANRRGSGPHPTATTPKRRQQAPCKAILVKRMRRYLELGKVSEAALWRSFAAVSETAAKLLHSAAFANGGKGTGIDDLVTAAHGMKRRVLFPILVKHRVIRLPESTVCLPPENAKYAPKRKKEGELPKAKAIENKPKE